MWWKKPTDFDRFQAYYGNIYEDEIPYKFIDGNVAQIRTLKELKEMIKEKNEYHNLHNT